MRRFLRIALAVIPLGLLATAPLAYARLESRSPAVSFSAVGPGGLKIVGKTNELRLNEGDSDFVVEVPLGRLDTGIALRDKHMKEKYLEVGTYPVARLSLPKSSVTPPTGGGSRAGDAKGSLTLHGKTKDVPVHWEAKDAGGQYNVRGTFRVDMREFGIVVPSYMGVTVKPDVDVEASFTAADSKG